MLHIKKIKPRYTSVITTADRYAEDVKNNGIITDSNETQGRIKWNQTVIAVGSSVRDLKEGDKVMLNSDRFAVRKFSKDSIQNDMDNNPVTSYVVPTMTIEDEDGKPKEILYIDDRDILFAFEGEEKNDSIILPNKPKIIVS